MLQTLLENKVIHKFLMYYEKNLWKKLIPSLLEIAILNLQSSFNTLIFSERDIQNIIKELKINHKKPFKTANNNIYPKKEIKQHIIFQKPPSIWRTTDGWVEKDSPNIYRYTQTWRKKNEKNLNKGNISSVKSKIKAQIYSDKKNYYNNIDYINNKLSQSYNQREKIDYAIIYDKDFNPKIIERACLKKNKKGGKKLIQKMTQKEYEQQYSEENNDNNEILCEENEENDYQEQKINRNNFKMMKNKNFCNPINFKMMNNNNIQRKNIININKKRNNLYHYKTNYKSQNNIFI